MFGRRDSPPPPPDPFARLVAWAEGLDSPWAPAVRRALRARDTFLTLLTDTQPGPTRQQLESLLPTVDEAVQRVARTIERARSAASIVARLDVDAATAQLKQARRDLNATRDAGRDSGPQEQLVAALAARHDAMHAALNLVEDTAHRLEDLNVRLETAVAHASTIVLRARLEPPDDVARELDEVIVGLVALDAAFDELPD
jgi:hypothetical protein